MSKRKKFDGLQLQYECEEEGCDRAFTSQQSLARHRTWHTKQASRSSTGKRQVLALPTDYPKASKLSVSQAHATDQVFGQSDETISFDLDYVLDGDYSQNDLGNKSHTDVGDFFNPLEVSFLQTALSNGFSFKQCAEIREMMMNWTEFKDGMRLRTLATLFKHLDDLRLQYHEQDITRVMTIEHTFPVVDVHRPVSCIVKFMIDDPCIMLRSLLIDETLSTATTFTAEFEELVIFLSSLVVKLFNVDKQPWN